MSSNNLDAAVTAAIFVSIGMWYGINNPDMGYLVFMLYAAATFGIVLGIRWMMSHLTWTKEPK